MPFKRELHLRVKTNHGTLLLPESEGAYIGSTSMHWFQWIVHEEPTEVYGVQLVAWEGDIEEDGSGIMEKVDLESFEEYDSPWEIESDETAGWRVDEDPIHNRFKVSLN